MGAAMTGPEPSNVFAHLVGIVEARRRADAATRATFAEAVIATCEAAAVAAKRKRE